MKRRAFLHAAAGCLAKGQADARGGGHTRPNEAAAPGDRRATEDSRRDPLPQVAWTRSVPVRYEGDVAVLGGGIAGVSAACAAARSGARVVLVERFAVTGGNATTGGVASFCGETAG